MYRDRDFDPALIYREFTYRRKPDVVEVDVPPNAGDLIQDLELETLFHAMAGGDRFLFAVARRAILRSLDEPEAITYRQDMLRDCLDHPDVVRAMYDLGEEAIERERKIWRSTYGADAILSGAVEVMQLLVEMLKRLRALADEHAGSFRSEGFARFFKMLRTELSDDYFGVVQEHLRRLKFRDGALISAELGRGNKGRNYVLRKPWPDKRSWMERVLGKGSRGYTYEIPPRDEAGAEALTRLRGRGINLVANALSQSADHVESFFSMLLAELGFYLGCLNLHDRLEQKGEPWCIPTPIPADREALTAQGLYDVCLTLRMEGRVVGNDIAGDQKDLVIVTGANQGGKSTFLRSVGLAQLMMQCGMFAPAASFSANVCHGVFTHYKREEDVTMKSGKFDEELSRMSVIVDQIAPGSLMLFNESFASTNEREGSEIGRRIVCAMLESDIKVVYVTHMFDLADGFRRQERDRTLFLRAEREPGGRRTFRLKEGEPLSTSYGPDLYREIFRDGGSQPSTTVPSAVTVAGSIPRNSA